MPRQADTASQASGSQARFVELPDVGELEYLQLDTLPASASQSEAQLHRTDERGSASSSAAQPSVDKVVPVYAGPEASMSSGPPEKSTERATGLDVPDRVTPALAQRGNVSTMLEVYNVDGMLFVFDQAGRLIPLHEHASNHASGGEKGPQNNMCFFLPTNLFNYKIMVL